jgi:hypothetical protein
MILDFAGLLAEVGIHWMADYARLLYMVNGEFRDMNNSIPYLPHILPESRDLSAPLLGVAKPFLVSLHPTPVSPLFWPVESKALKFPARAIFAVPRHPTR